MPKKSPASGSRFQLSNSFVFVSDPYPDPPPFPRHLLYLGADHRHPQALGETRGPEHLSSFVRIKSTTRSPRRHFRPSRRPIIRTSWRLTPAWTEDRLLAVCQDLWRQLQTYGLKQFRFNILTPSGDQVFLRVHQPDQYGDLISASRPTVVKAIQDKALVFGLEQGKSGYGFRSVTPCSTMASSLGPRRWERISARASWRA